MIITKTNPNQAEEISKLIIASIKKFNSKEISEREMKYLMKKNQPKEIREIINKKEIFCAIKEDKIVGVIGIDITMTKRIMEKELKK